MTPFDQLNQESAVPSYSLCVLGPSGVGKTTLLAAFYGSQSKNEFEEERKLRIVASNKSQRSLLSHRYNELEFGRFPEGTAGFESFRFNVKVTGLSNPGAEFVWHDYPGGWWTDETSDPAESKVRLRGFRTLLSSQVGMFLLDGEKIRTTDRATSGRHFIK